MVSSRHDIFQHLQTRTPPHILLLDVQSKDHFLYSALFAKETSLIFKQCHRAKKCGRGTLWHFLTAIVLQNIEPSKGETLWCNSKIISKKSHSSKKIQVKNTKGGSLVCFLFRRFGTSMFLFWTRFWRFEYVLDVRSSI